MDRDSIEKLRSIHGFVMGLSIDSWDSSIHTMTSLSIALSINFRAGDRFFDGSMSIESISSKKHSSHHLSGKNPTLFARGSTLEEAVLASRG